MTSLRPSVLAGSRVQLADYRPGDSFGPRRLHDHEFVWLVRGSAVWTVTDAEVTTEHRLTPGQVALARSGTVDSYQWDQRRPSTHAYVHFSLDRPAGLPPPADWPAVHGWAGQPLLEGLCRYLVELSGLDSPAARSRTDELLGLLLDVFVTGPLPDRQAALPPALAALADHVQSRWSADLAGPAALDITELSAAAHVSPGHLFRLFREAYGCGPARALELVRLASAATSLQRSNATIAEVARACGFANPYHFSRRFSSAYGSPPGAYRRLGAGPDAWAPVRAAGLLPLAHAILRPAGVSQPRDQAVI